MTTVQNPLRFRINNVRCDWPELFEGKQMKDGTGKFRCGIKLLVPKDHKQFSQIEAAIQLAAKEKWKEKAEKNLMIAGTKDNVSFRNGDLQKSEDYAGHFILSANCQGGDTEEKSVKPTVYGLNPKDGAITDPRKSQIYRGCFVNALVEVYADSRFGDGIFSKLVGVQFHSDGPAFGGKQASEDDFEVMAGADAEDFA